MLYFYDSSNPGSPFEQVSVSPALKRGKSSDSKNGASEQRSKKAKISEVDRDSASTSQNKVKVGSWTKSKLQAYTLGKTEWYP